MAVAALAFWRPLIVAKKTAERSEQEAARAAWMRRPAGPASYPGMVALVREYWLACDALNRKCAEEERVPPWTFLLSWLMDESHYEAVGVLACMPYWPIGLDEDGNWV